MRPNANFLMPRFAQPAPSRAPGALNAVRAPRPVAPQPINWGGILGGAADQLTKGAEMAENQRRWDATNARAQEKHDASMAELAADREIYGSILGGEKPKNELVGATSSSTADPKAQNVVAKVEPQKIERVKFTKKDATPDPVSSVKGTQEGIAKNIPEEVKPNQAKGLYERTMRASRAMLARGKAGEAAALARLAETYRDQDPNSAAAIKSRIEIKRSMMAEKLLDAGIPNFKEMSGEQIADWQASMIAAGQKDLAKMADPYIATDSFGKKATGAAETEVLDLGAVKDDLDAIERNMDEDSMAALTYQGQAEQWLYNQAEKLGADLTPYQKETIDRQSRFVANAQRYTNRMIKWYSGAAVSAQEAKRLQKEMADAATDGPTAFKAKFEEAKKRVQVAANRLKYIMVTKKMSRKAATEYLMKGNGPSLDESTMKRERKKLYDARYKKLRNDRTNRRAKEADLRLRAFEEVNGEFGFLM